MSLLNNAAENAYRRLLEHCKTCRRCERQGDGGDVMLMCPIGHRLLTLWEVAESNVNRVA